MATDRSKYGNTILHDAASQGSLDVMKYLINTHHYDLMTNNSGETVLHFAVKFIDVDGQTPLHYAARRGTPEVIEYFLSTGNCDPLAKDYEGKTPLQLAKGRQDDSDTVIAIFKKNAAKVDPCTAGIKPYKLEHMELAIKEGRPFLVSDKGHKELKEILPDESLLNISNLSLLGGRDIKEAIDITEEFNTPLTPEPTSQNKSSSASSSTQINESDLDIKGDGGVKCNNNKDKGTTTNTLNESQKHGSTSIEKGQSDIDVVKIDDKLQEIRTDKLLDIRDLATVIQELTSNHQFDYTNWKQLGLYLGLYQPTLKAIEVNCRGQVWECLMECLSSWLKGEDGVRDTRGGGSNWISLVAALDAIGEREVANNIRIKYKL
ncbi:PREDICTED: uncharacterized protein LOC109585887 [Amphimedon queenslandica]|uniref:Death domain-containing protein n=1 Tax=Amphimedon queenslandica TaxID=400682 RepID=A0AAN0JLB0_AMPQE|nr:PREDICTED: uncharacterized protein LOC109585887 [Amphimedon queenslandica]|eukprot:XP_019857590.1 PREDICTED: uncharacterized protein LOC109585887 [Amphimedon queenslandica]